MKKIEKAIGFLMPPEIGDQNFRSEKPSMILTPLFEPLREENLKRDREYEERFRLLEEKFAKKEEKLLKQL